MDGDRPITQRKDDRLGFSEIADRLASALVDQSAPEGLVFGIEGKWGSGKSSLINLTIEALKSRGAAAPEVISFSPWLIGDCDVLLRSLFDELANAAVKIDPIEAALTGAETSKSRKNVAARNSHWKLQQKVRIRNALGKKLKTFGSVAGTIGKLARVAGTFGVPAGELVGTALERGASAAKDLKESAPLSKLKSELVDALRLLSRRIAVFIDDLDRLEPREAAEVLRLIRAVADFPNVIYVLSYDPDVIANILMKAVQVDDGAAFLEKIVQVSFRIPKPEAFDLRRWFQAEVCQMFSAELDVGSAQSEATQRLAEVIDIQGDRYLETGRDVTRVLNALRLHALPVRTLIDIPDMVWLQLVRIGNAKFYEWIEDYVTEIAAAVSGARVTDGAPETMARRLEQILKEEGLDVDRSIMELGEVLPGIDPGIGGGLNRDVRRVFNNLGKQSINAFVASRRLGSPQHYRYYFAFSHPAGALPDEQVQAFIESAERAPSDAIQMFIDLADVSRPQGGTMAEVLIERLVAPSDRVPTNAITGVLAALARAMDQPGLSFVASFGERAAWHSAERAVKELLRRLIGDARAVALGTLFEQGEALGWLTNLLAHEIVAHGRAASQADPEHQWLITAVEFAGVSSTMLNRYRTTPPAELMRVPNLLQLLLAWRQISGTDEPRRWVASQTTSDTGLLCFLSRVRGWAASSNIGLYYPLRSRDLEDFIDFEGAVRRVGTISENAAAPEDQRKRASELLMAIEQGRRF